MPGQGPFPGLVVKWRSFRDVNLNKVWGYEILYDAGDVWYMLEEVVQTYLVDNHAVNNNGVGVVEMDGIDSDDWDRGLGCSGCYRS